MASRNVGFEASRMNEFLMANQGQVKVRSFNDKQVYDEIESNSDLYIFNQLVDHD